jgi:hypothetical protein
MGRIGNRVGAVNGADGDGASGGGVGAGVSAGAGSGGAGSVGGRNKIIRVEEPV